MCTRNFISNQTIYSVIGYNDTIQYEQLEVQIPVEFSDFLIDEEDFNAAKPIDQAMEEMLENELDWRISDLEKDNLDE